MVDHGHSVVEEANGTDHQRQLYIIRVTNGRLIMHNMRHTRTPITIEEYPRSRLKKGLDAYKAFSQIQDQLSMTCYFIHIQQAHAHILHNDMWEEGTHNTSIKQSQVTDPRNNISYGRPDCATRSDTLQK